MNKKAYAIEQFIKTGEKLNKEHWIKHDELTKNRIADLSGDMLVSMHEWLSSIKIYANKNLKNNPLYDDINTAIFHNKNKITDYDKMMGYLRAILNDINSTEEDETADSPNKMKESVIMKDNFKRLPLNSGKLLKEIVESENPSKMLGERFEKCASLKEDKVLRSLLRELIDEKYIKINWADNMPYYVQINNSARTYEEQEEEYASIRETSNGKKIKEYDVFISHANSDKNDYVNKLVETIDKLGINIFYDKNILSWGDNWKEIILSGTEKSEFAIIVISDSFFDREWTEIELSEFLQRQNKIKQKTVLPLLHNITLDQLKDKYPALQYIQALKSNENSTEQIAILLAKELIKRYKIN
ncbi:toll/interleukin-1 receptor domain-containing protein [Clostridium sp. E02]|uniref:toll/interleukin-1 receptor domain-containing protein n=1 Tax=Clostridium sp. E02 TaxID=2487134 RepID=UPI001FAA9DE8|nr:toll/interleukin-1 receptor domain-containing protein [Clostridium sp. E02]